MCELKTIEMWVNIYPSGEYETFRSLENAEDWEQTDIVARINAVLIYREGEGLENVKD